MFSASGSEIPAPKEGNMTKSSSVEFALVGEVVFGVPKQFLKK